MMHLCIMLYTYWTPVRGGTHREEILSQTSVVVGILTRLLLAGQSSMLTTTLLSTALMSITKRLLLKHPPQRISYCKISNMCPNLDLLETSG